MLEEDRRTEFIRRREEPTVLSETYVLLFCSPLLMIDARQFIMAKQHENTSLHALVQGIAMNDITWLAIPGSSRPNPQETGKRRRLLEDLITWLFEGYLIPLLRVRLSLLILRE